jgi:hypothetical protein
VAHVRGERAADGAGVVRGKRAGLEQPSGLLHGSHERRRVVRLQALDQPLHALSF